MEKKKIKKKLKNIARYLAPKNNRFTREFADKVPYVILGMALGAVLLHSWVGQPTTIKGTTGGDISTGRISPISPSENIIKMDNPVRFTGYIESWPELRKHIGETIALKIVVLNAATIETKMRSVDNLKVGDNAW